MKSLTAVCQTGASMPAINPSGRIARHPHQRGDGENAEMKMYLSKLKDLVPFMPKNRKLSKLEIIQHVIDYICDLQTELESHPEIGNFDAAAALNYNDEDADDEDDVELGDAATPETSAHIEHDILTERLSSAAAVQQPQPNSQNSSPGTTRQPLVDRQAPNTFLPATAITNTTVAVAQQQQEQQQQQYQQHLILATAQNSQMHTVDKDSRQSC